MSTLVGHFVSSLRERDKTESTCRGDEKRGTGEKGRNESKGKKKINKKHSPLSLPAARIAGLV